MTRGRRTGRAAAAALALGMLPGCARAWNAANRADLKADVGTLLAAHGVTPSGLDCRMEGTTRDASCSFRAPAAELEAFTRALNLAPVPPGGDAQSPLARLVARAPGRCGAGPASEAHPPAFGIDGRPAVLRLKSGRAFEFLVLFRRESEGEACLFLSYSFG